MSTKRTILSEKEADLIDRLIAEHGVIVDFDQVFSILAGTMSRQAARNLVGKLTGNGWLVRIKKGVYFVAGTESRGFAALPVYKIAQIFTGESYVSFEAALQFHGFFDQYLKAVISVSPGAYSGREFQGIDYRFIKAKRELYYGFEEERVDGYLVKIATVEKAMLDLINFRRTAYSVDLVLEHLREHGSDFDAARLSEYIAKQSHAVRRIMGYLLDLAGLDSEQVHAMVKNTSGPTFMLKNSKDFNARWRLYVPPRA
jgi:predicted transcriptional regulator of viral defense system